MAQAERNCRIAFSPNESSTFGGGTIVVAISEDTNLPEDCEVYLAFIGSQQRHIVQTHRVNSDTLQAHIPSHNLVERVELRVYVCYSSEQTTTEQTPTTTTTDCSGRNRYELLGTGNHEFSYTADNAYYIVEYLINNATDENALLNIERSFNLTDEAARHLDDRIIKELENISLPNDWTVLPRDKDCEPIETLFHFAARWGLEKLTGFLCNRHRDGLRALTVRNRDGESPRDIARDYGYDKLAKFIEFIESHVDGASLPLQQHRSSETKNTVVDAEAVIENLDGGLVSLRITGKQSNQRIEEDIDKLKQATNSMMDPSSAPRVDVDHAYETSGPKRRTMPPKNTTPRRRYSPPDRHMSFPDQLTDKRDTNMLPFRRISSPDPPYISQAINIPNSPQQVRSYSDTTSCDSNSDEDESDVDAKHTPPVQHSYRIYQAQQRPTQLRRQSTEPAQSDYTRRKNIPSIELASPSGTTKILEESIQQAHNITESILQNKHSNPYQNTVQDARKGRLCRFSSSCPSLAEQEAPPAGRLMNSPIISGCHSSMLDIAQEHRYNNNDMRDAHAYSSIDMYCNNDTTGGAANSIETNVKICINDVTVESTDDNYAADAANSQYEFDRKLKKSKRRRSWCPQNSQGLSSQNAQPRSPKQLAVMGRSMSLSSLDSNDESSTSSSSSDEEEEEEDEQYHDASESQPSQSQQQTPPPVGRSYNASQHDSSLSSISIGTPKANSTPSDSDKGVRSNISSMNSSATGRSLTDVRFDSSIEQSESIQPSNAIPLSLMQYRSPSPDISQTSSKTNDLLVLPQNLTKSISTPSILTEKQTNQDTSPTSWRRDVQKSFAMCIADERHITSSSSITTGSTTSGQIKSSIHGNQKPEHHTHSNRSEREVLPAERKTSPSRDIYDTSNYEEDEFAATKKEIKKERRRSSVFSLSQKFGSYRQKKIKEKENRRNTHQFVSVSFSNSTNCDVCSKSMANKSALRCANCLVNVHESSCKDQIAPCTKFRHASHHHHHHNKTVLRQSHTPSSPMISGGLKTTQSMKEKKSSSAPIRNSVAYSSSPTQRKESPPSNADRTGNGGGSYGHFQWRRVATKLGIDKVINEENEESKDISDGNNANITNSLSASVESLEDVVEEFVDFEDEEDLALNAPEPEAWSITVDKKTLKKMQPKDIKRQDHLYELVLTERHHYRTLKIMQKIFARGMAREVQLSQDKISRIFPKLEMLIEIHDTFLSNLEGLQQLKKDGSIDQIGDLLIEQFQGENATKLVTAYGDFCSKHNDAVNYYKDLHKSDKKFQAFIKKCSISPVCKRQGIPECILLVTQRMTKYPLLLEPIIKTTKDKTDRENVHKALILIKRILAEVDKQVEAFEKSQRFLDIYNKLDARSFAWFKKERKFKKSDILSNNRKLLHEGLINWKTARGKLTEVLAVIITDVMFFLQENNQKYTFFSQDGKSAVIPLYRLLVREKGDTRDSKGIYVINQSRNSPEMYEIVCKSSEQRRQWIEIMRKAIKNCPVEEEESIPVQTEEEKRLQEAKAAKLKELIEHLHRQDKAIQRNCDQKFKYLLEILELSTGREIQTPPPVQGKSMKQLIEMTFSEVTRLQLMVQSTGGNLNRSISSAGERESAQFQPVPLPKRAETFTAFDAKNATTTGFPSKMKAGIYQSVKDAAGRSASLQNLNRQESDSDLLLTVDTSKLWNMRRGSAGLADKENKKQERNDRRLSTSFLQGILKPHGEKDGSPPADGAMATTEHPSFIGDVGVSYKAIAATFTSFPQLSTELEQTLVYLARNVHELLKSFSQYDSQVESNRVKLQQATSQISTLTAENHKIMQEKKGQYKHNQQLEELRNLQETIRQERELWEKEKEKDREKIDRQYAALDEKMVEIEKQKTDLKAQHDELQKRKDVLQKQWDIYNEQVSQHKTLSGTSSLSVSGSPTINHRRSASAEFSKNEEDSTFHHGSKPEHTGSFRDPDPRIQRPRSDVLPSASRKDLPIHLLSATNEQKLRGIKQHLPLQLSGLHSSNSSSSLSSIQTAISVQQQIPNKLQSSTSSSSMPQPPQHSSSSPNLISQIPGKFGMTSKSSPTGSTKSSPGSPLGLPLKLAEGKGSGRVSSPTGSGKDKKKGKHSKDEYYF
ncbi:uncharacterized protein LOC141906481 isoform X3 [Tubulanus polymorphus]|uniref:uncharacterized protein LOC141906481 isoform X3 n=1 Tax=Tubulanus polymorphus TaxID=672921 RepID=UPI003DA262A6